MWAPKGNNLITKGQSPSSSEMRLVSFFGVSPKKTLDFHLGHCEQNDRCDFLGTIADVCRMERNHVCHVTPDTLNVTDSLLWLERQKAVETLDSGLASINTRGEQY